MTVAGSTRIASQCGVIERTWGASSSMPFSCSVMASRRSWCSLPTVLRPLPALPERAQSSRKGPKHETLGDRALG